MEPLFAEFRSGHRRAQPPADLVIRQARDADVRGIARLVAARSGKRVAETRSTIQSEFARMAVDPTPRKLLCVAESGGRIVGFGRATLVETARLSGSRGLEDGWYLMGVLVAPALRGRGVAWRLTDWRLRRIRARADQAFYFANARNQVSVALHRGFGFEELTREFAFPNVTFSGGEGILFALRW